MTVFDLDGNVPVWFELEDGGRVQLRALDADTLKALRKQCVKRRVEYKRVDGRAERFEVEEFDEEKHNALFWDAVIVGWEQFFDAKGQPIPCTTDMKLALLTKSARFLTFVSDAMKRLNADEAQREEDAVKN